jgi:hypothetical protein
MVTLSFVESQARIADDNKRDWPSVEALYLEAWKILPDRAGESIFIHTTGCCC